MARGRLRLTASQQPGNRKEVSFAFPDGADSNSGGDMLVNQLLPKYKAAKAAKDEDSIKALEVVCPALAAAFQAPPAESPEVQLERQTACLRRLHAQQEKLKNQLVANAKDGKELVGKLEENVQACAETQAEVTRLTSLTTTARGASTTKSEKDRSSESAFQFPELPAEDVELFTPEQKKACEEALGHAQKAQQVYKKNIGEQAREAAETLRELREKAQREEPQLPEPTLDFSSPQHVDAFIQKTAAIKARRVPFGKRRHVSIFFGDVANYGPKVKKFVESAPYDLLGPQQKSIDHDALQDISVVLWRLHCATFAFIACYLDCSIGLVGINAKKLTTIIRIIKSLDVPWLLVGGFKATPSEMSRSGWLDALQGEVITPEGVEVTCTSGKGRIIDYVIVLHGFCPFVHQVLPVQTLPWGPHIGLNITIASRPASVLLGVPVPPVPLVTPVGEVRAPEGTKRQQRDRQRHARSMEATNDTEVLQVGDLLTEETAHLLSDHYTTKCHFCCEDADWAVSVREAKDNAAYCEASHTSDALAKHYAVWTIAAESQLAELRNVEPRRGARASAVTMKLKDPHLLDTSRWARLHAQGPMEEARRFLKKLEHRALDETCVNPSTLEELAARPHHDREGLVTALKSFPMTTGIGADQWKPRRILALSDQGQDDFVTLLNTVERGLAWPRQLLNKRFALLPKGDRQVIGNERDIGLLPMPVRIWGRMAKTPLTEWRDAEAAHWGAAIKGSSALQAALKTMVMDGARARTVYNEQGNVLVDVERFYGYMDLSLMTDQAMALEFPAAELYLRCLTYTAPRVIRAQGAYAEEIYPVCSIVPGRGKANHCAGALLCRLLEKAHQQAPLASVRQCVDDVRSRVEGPAAMVLDQTEQVSVSLVQGMLDLGLRVSATSILAMSMPAHELEVQKHVLAATGIKIKRAKWAKDLGIDCNVDQRAKYRCADPAVGVAPSEMKLRRARAADLAGHATGGRCIATVMLLPCQDDEPKMSALMDQVKNWFQPWVATPDMRGRVRRRWRAVLKKLICTRPRARWKCVTGPMGALILSFRELGWTPRAPDAWVDDQGDEWRRVSDHDSCDELYQALGESVRRELWRAAAQHPEGRGLEEGGDPQKLRLNVRRLCRKDHHREAGVLEANALASTWTKARAKAAGCVCDYVCNRCGLWRDTIGHRLNECTVDRQLEHEWAARTDGLCEAALGDLSEGNNVSFWTRGIVPPPWNPVPKAPE
ncbi:unnamed protein product [Prorocentrum cordatum]|uniref:Uncharacterized protein n=1 Tax=Prorocentrum cordatum TaxID=2364126 RepID=A0ABN9Q883_9DINO|nr:unnamed protein product [Polarella glacialis]